MFWISAIIICLGTQTTEKRGLTLIRVCVPGQVVLLLMLLLSLLGTPSGIHWCRPSNNPLGDLDIVVVNVLCCNCYCYCYCHSSLIILGRIGAALVTIHWATDRWSPRHPLIASLITIYHPTMSLYYLLSLSLSLSPFTIQPCLCHLHHFYQTSTNPSFNPYYHKKKKQLGIHWSDHQIPKQQTWRDFNSLFPCFGIHDSQPNISILIGLNIFHDINLDQWGGRSWFSGLWSPPKMVASNPLTTLCDRPYLIVQGGVHYPLCSHHWCTSITYALNDQTATFLQINNSANQNEAVGCKSFQSWSPVAQCAHSLKGCEESPYCSTRNKPFF